VDPTPRGNCATRLACAAYSATPSHPANQNVQILLLANQTSPLPRWWCRYWRSAWQRRSARGGFRSVGRRPGG